MTGLLGYNRVLVVTAVEAERAAVLAGLGLDPGATTAVEAERAAVPALLGLDPGATTAVEAQRAAVPALLGLDPGATTAVEAQRAAVPALLGLDPGATTAVEAQRAAVPARLGLDPGATVGGDAGRSRVNVDGDQFVEVVAVGVGPAAAGAATARLLATAALPFDAVICAGIAGGFAGRIEVGGLAVATESIAADLGASSSEGFIGLDDLGFGAARRAVDPALLASLRAALPEAVAGPVLSVSTVTGTAEEALELQKRHPDAVAEAMEGFGAATAAALERTVFGEVRTISNLVGPRDRSTWRIAPALEALRGAFRRLA